MSTMVRRFIFYTEADWHRFVAFIKANIKDMAAQERWLQAVVSEYKASRTGEQNAYMWAGVLSPTAEQAWTGGRRLSDEGWNLVFKCLFLPEMNAKGMDKWLFLPDGSRQLMMSTSDLNHAEMGEYLTKIAAYATTDLGVHLPVNPRDL